MFDDVQFFSKTQATFFLSRCGRGVFFVLFCYDIVKLWLLSLSSHTFLDSSVMF